jgi:hypothetical protein
VRERVGRVDWLAVGEMGDAILNCGVVCCAVLFRRKNISTRLLEGGCMVECGASAVVLRRECLPVS